MVKTLMVVATIATTPDRRGTRTAAVQRDVPRDRHEQRARPVRDEHDRLGGDDARRS